MIVVVMFSGVIKNIRADWLYSAQLVAYLAHDVAISVIFVLRTTENLAVHGSS